MQQIQLDKAADLQAGPDIGYRLCYSLELMFVEQLTRSPSLLKLVPLSYLLTGHPAQISRILLK